MKDWRRHLGAAYRGAFSAREQAAALTEAYHELVRKVHASGVPQAEIAKCLGVCRQRVSQVVRGKG